MSQRANGLAEARADAVHNLNLKYLNLVPDTDFTAFLKCKLVEWYAAAPKNDSRAPPGEEADEEASVEGREGGGRIGGLDALYGLVIHCNPISRPKKTDRRKGQAAAAFDSNLGASEPDRGRS